MLAARGSRCGRAGAPMADRDLADLLAANEISSVRLQATNHDGLVLGKYLSTPKFVSIAERGTMLADTTFGVDFSGDVALGWDWGSWRGEVADIRAVPDVATLTRDPALPQLAIGDLRLRRPRRRAAADLPARDAEAGDRRACRPWPRSDGRARDRVLGLRAIDPRGARSPLPGPHAPRRAEPDHLSDVALARPGASSCTPWSGASTRSGSAGSRGAARRRAGRPRSTSPPPTRSARPTGSCGRSSPSGRSLGSWAARSPSWGSSTSISAPRCTSTSRFGAAARTRLRTRGPTARAAS